MSDQQVPVYIVDDDKAVRESLTSLLELEGYGVKGYATANAFLADIDDETVGVLLLDVRLPDINGLEVQSILVKQNSKLSIIIITGHGDVPMAVQAVRAGAVNFIEKPFIGDTVVDSVREAETEALHSAGNNEERRDVQAHFDQLTPRERDVLHHLIIGQRNKIIAYELGISPRTVEVHRANLMEKMRANSVSHLVRKALLIGLDPDAS